MNRVNASELQALLGSIRISLGNVNFSPFNNRQACGTVYEVYTFGILLEEARNAGADLPVFFYGDRIPATQPYKFRRSASNLSKDDDYTYAELTFSRARKPKLPLEVHVGIYVCGPSCERVQSDVCVLFKSEADYFRNNPSRPRPRKSPYLWPNAQNIIITTECKYYSSDLRSQVINEVIGRDYELLAAKNHLVVANTPSLLAANRVIGRFNAEAWSGEVFPTNAAGERKLRDLIRGMFRRYIDDDNNIQP